MAGASLTPKHHKNKTGPSHRFPNNSQQTDGGCISATHLLVTGPLTWSQMDKSGAERREVIYYNRERFPIWTRNNFLCRCFWGGCSCNCDDSIRIFWCKDINHCRGARKWPRLPRPWASHGITWRVNLGQNCEARGDIIITIDWETLIGVTVLPSNDTRDTNNEEMHYKVTPCQRL